MEKFLKKIFEGSNIEPPVICLKSFNENFDNAINTEWFDKGDFFEVIFYNNKIEYIANFSKSGNLEEYKMYLPINFLPETIKIHLENFGEIMNVVLINKGNCVQYEVIVRDKDLNRHLFLLSDLGEIMSEKSL